MPFSPIKTLIPLNSDLLHPRANFFLKIHHKGYIRHIIEDLEHYLCTPNYNSDIKYYSAVLLDRWLVDDQITSHEFEEKLKEQATLIGLGIPPDDMGFPLGFSINEKNMKLYSNFANARNVKLENRAHDKRNYFNFMDAALQFGTYIHNFFRV